MTVWRVRKNRHQNRHKLAPYLAVTVMTVMTDFPGIGWQKIPGTTFSTRWQVESRDINSRIERGRKAIALARAKGLGTASWEKELARLEEELRQAQEAATRTRKLLETRGWCLWRCRALDDEVIVVLRDELVDGFPAGYPVYLEQELECLIEADDSALKLIHETKKLAGATITGVEKREKME